MMGRKEYLRGLGLGILVTALLMGLAKGNGREMTDEEIRERAAELGMIENTVLAETEETLQKPEAEEADKAAQPEQKPEAAETDKAAQPEQKPEAAETDKAAQSEQKPEAEEADKEAQPEQKPEAAETDKAAQSEQKSEAEEADKAAQSEQKPEAEETDKAAQSEQKSETDKVSQPEQKSETDKADSTAKEETTVGSREDYQLTIVSGDSSVSVAVKLEQAGIISSAASYDAYLCANGYDKKIRAGSYTIPGDAGEEEIARIITGMN